MYIVEDDTRTHAENPFYAEKFEMFTMEDSINVLKRDFGRNICEDLQGWWFDQHVGGGRYKFPEIYKLFEKQQKISEFAYSFDRTKGNEIAFIYDEESMHTVSRQTTEDLIEVFRNYEIANIGAGADSYFHNDMSNPDMPDYKLYVFCNCICLSDKEREDIKNKLRKNHATALFLYGNGFINPDRDKKLDVKHITELTGIKCDEIMQKSSPMFKINDIDNDIAKGLDKTSIFGSFLKLRKGNVGYTEKIMPRSYLFPIIYANDEDATNIGTFARSKLPAVAQKEADGFTSVYCGSKYINAEFVREVARFAGCHIYDDDGHDLYVNKNFITVHASKSGSITLNFKEKCSPFELYEDKQYGENISVLTFEAKLGETKMFWLKKEE